MIERDIVSRQILEYQIKEYIMNFLDSAGVSDVVVKRTPLGEKIIVHTSRPGMVVGRSGKNIKDLTEQLKQSFELENPQVEIAEVEEPGLNANIVAERIASSLERYGPTKFKSIIHRAVEDTMAANALGVEVLVSGKIPSARARVWRVSTGYLKKCGEPALKNVDVSYKVAKLKSGVVGVVVKIMPPDVVLPDAVILKDEEQQAEKAEEGEKVVEEAKAEKTEQEKTEQQAEAEKVEQEKTEKQTEAEKTEQQAEKVEEQEKPSGEESKND